MYLRKVLVKIMVFFSSVGELRTKIIILIILNNVIIVTISHVWF